MSLTRPNKRIVVCLDGTWNEPSEATDDPLDKTVPTNVLKLVRAIKPVDDHEMVQCVYYDEGIGTNWGVDKLVGGGLGIGLDENIRQAYRFIANNYQDGDHLFLFGFSRGAYTARSLAGFIGAVGLLPKYMLRFVPEAYDVYRLDKKERYDSRHWRNLTRSLGYKYDPEDESSQIPIHFIGVWDTVGALGAPTPLLGRLTRKKRRYHNTNLGPNIKHAYHAMAIDERRRPFQPSLWTGEKKDDQTVEQVWFTGVHSNIGGSYRDTQLSDLTMTWMMHRARRHGLGFTTYSIKQFLKRAPEEQAKQAREGILVNSFSGAYQFLRLFRVKPYTREMGPKQSGDIRRSDAQVIGEMIHQSAIDRCNSEVTFYRKRRQKEPVKQPYRPENLLKAQAELEPQAYDDPI